MQTTKFKIHKYTWTSPDGKPHSKFDNILIDRRRHSIVLDAPLFRAANFDTDQYLLAATIRERLAKRFGLKKLNELEGKELFRAEVSNRFAALED
jgi:hypothetical protein